ncbi:hypothetical protein A2634_02720 [Candidatus Amesbacteria bacterium RIFCSPHIGHO2_01_FULL_48_32]|uniref:Uncharacterized protein n=1 Tax=Candidatus Amesbacteria bacterium RIFCSPLOWO2_01_FULL_48_25 TaxID=1797259 RepID=A0A1F4ZDL1_9BACT|nr:MAG: hypothetical protein A2634_02720 [Candidatus Amesbacteria bacterium RIFCSPHIGHO2_01_FULL_48_32]OGD04225.1 MAG: hypothetical protein A2989_01975 [Candidatus Amesbacteria bacterium RIFCSPLOWO2_01_FULL_48_25]
MWTQFFLQNAHFSLGLFAGITFFLCAWLYWDSDTGHHFWTIATYLGFAVLGLSFLAQALIPQTNLGTHLISPSIIAWVILFTKVTGLILLIAGFWSQPKISRPPSS